METCRIKVREVTEKYVELGFFTPPKDGSYSGFWWSFNILNENDRQKLETLKEFCRVETVEELQDKPVRVSHYGVEVIAIYHINEERYIPLR